MPAMSTTRLLPAAVVFLAALGIRFAYLAQIAGSPFFNFLHLDPLYYHEWALRIAAGNWLGGEVFEMSPLYSYLMALHIFLLGDDLWTLRIIQMAAGALTCVLTYLLGERLFDRATGILAGLGCALYGPFLFYEGQVMKEFLTPLLGTAALLFALAPRSGHRRAGDAGTWIPPAGGWRLAASGMLLATAALVRDNVLLLVPVLAVWARLASGPRSDNVGQRPAHRHRGWVTAGRLRAPLCLIAGAAVVLIPVGLRNLAVGGDFVLTTSGGGEVFYIGNGPYANGAYVPPPWVRSNPRYEHQDFRDKARALSGREMSRAEASRFWWREGLSWMAKNPWRTAKLWLRKFALFWNDHELPDNYSYASFIPFAPLLRFMLTFGIVASFAWAGFALTLPFWRRLLPLHLCIAAYMLSVMIVFNFARFRLPVVPLLLVLGAAFARGLATTLAGLAAGRLPGRRILASVVVLLAGYGFMSIDWSSASEEPFQDRLHLAAAWREAGHPERAVTVLEEVIRDAERVIRNHGGDPSRAETIPGGITFKLALSAAHRDLAGILQEQGRAPEAAVAYGRASALAPEDSTLSVRRAAALMKAGDPVSAEAVLREAVARDPGSFAAGFDLATLLHASGRSEEALTALQRARDAAVNLGPLDLADFHYGMATILMALPGRDAEVAAHLREALKLNPDADQAEGAREILESLSAS